MNIKTGAAVFAALLVASASPASAEMLNFTLTGAASATWTIDSNPTPNATLSTSFSLDDVAGDYSGLPGIGPIVDLADMQFYTTAFEGGLTIRRSNGPTLVDALGLQLWTGSVNAPEFILGTYTLRQISNSSILYTLEIAAVPEPATWAMMIAGFGLTGAALRNRKTKVAFSAA